MSGERTMKMTVFVHPLRITAGTGAPGFVFERTDANKFISFWTGLGGAVLGFTDTSARLAIGSYSYANRYSLGFPTTTEVMSLLPTGNVGIGTIAPGSRLHTVLTDAGTNDTQNVLILGRNSSGTPAANFTGRIAMQLKSSITANQEVASMKFGWNVATDASRSGDLIFSAYYTTTEREIIRLRGGASSGLLAFFGGTPVARQTGGALTTGATYTANEQTMLQRLWDAVRNFNLLD